VNAVVVTLKANAKTVVTVDDDIQKVRAALGLPSTVPTSD
jgi:hypothetical protein